VDSEELPDSATREQQLSELVVRGQRTMANAWMVRTFIKHCDEVEDYPELNEIARSIFDTFRALETQVDDPASYMRFLRKKLGKLKKASAEFKKNAWHASTHTNFQQAVIATGYVVEQLQSILAESEVLLPKPAPPKITLPVKPRSTPGTPD
jgi:hypothetical protein